MIDLSRKLSCALVDRALVRLCVGEGDDVSAAWQAWIAAAVDLATWNEERYPRHWRDLLPLVAYRQRQASLDAPAWLVSRLRMAAVLEERRLPAVYETTAEILTLVDLVRNDPLVIGGLAIGETAYPAPATRHTGVLTIMLADGSRLRPIMQRLIGRSYRVRRAGIRSLHFPGSKFARLWLTHPTGFHLMLLSTTVGSRFPMLHSGLLGRAQRVRTGNGLEFLAPSHADALALIEHGVRGEQSPDSLVPAVDRGLLGKMIARRVVVDDAYATIPKVTAAEPERFVDDGGN